MRLIGWEAEGLRCPDHSIRLTTEARGPSPVSLIQMPNGTGKTTTLTLLRAALAGRATKFTPEGVESFRKNKTSDAGFFRVQVEAEGKLTTFALEFDFEQGAVAATTTVPGGMKQGFHPPRSLDLFLHNDFVEFFVFDGELAEALIDRRHTDAERAIDSLFRLRSFSRIRPLVEEYWERQVAGRTALKGRGLVRRRNDVKRLKARIRKLKSEREEKHARYEAVENEVEALEERFKEALEEQDEKKAAVHLAKQELIEARGRVEAQLGAVAQAMRNPLALASRVGERLEDLRNSLDRAKLPESAAREFFIEVAEEAECICGRPNDPYTRTVIRERAEEYLAGDDVALLNAMKGQIGDETDGKRGEERVAHFRELAHELRERVLARENKRTARDAAEAEAAAGDPELEKVSERLNLLRSELEQLRGELDRYEDPTESAGHDETWGIEVLRRRLERAEQKVAEITDTLSLKEKRDALMEILTLSQEMARGALGQSITEATNQRIQALMPHNEIRLRGIDQCLVLEGQEEGSTGENLSVAYAFLSTLFERSGRGLPFVVDSPANPIDLRVREEVARLVPRLTPQFVAFVISSEREGFVDRLIEACEGQVQFLTLFRKGKSERDGMARGAGEVDETDDGLLVAGEDFFRRFHLDTET